MTTRTRTKSASGEFHHGESYCGNRGPKGSWSIQSGFGMGKYYAGAKFDTIPSLSDLPTPPRHWTDPAARSQSTPSSPVTITSKPGAGISLDIGSIFRPGATPGTSNCDRPRAAGEVFKSSSLPGKPEMMSLMCKAKAEDGADAVFKTPEKLKARPTVKVPTKPKKVSKGQGKNIGGPSPVTAPAKPTPPSNANVSQRTPEREVEVKGNGKSRAPGISGLDLMEMLLRASPTNPQDFLSSPLTAKKMTPVKLSPSSCHLELGSADFQYKDVSDHLKSILKVSVSA